ncbi:MAG: U32 family peptidase [Bacillota bacterium]|nr:U32 family peptidase [Bacillota bacterium]
MKITVGMGSIDEYISFVEAGADEVFIGYVPSYMKEFSALNRREVYFSNVQIGARSELQILSRMVDKYRIPVSITMNSLSYPESMYPYIKRMIDECLEDGFDTFIVADIHLLEYLKKERILERIRVHISGEIGELNSYTLKYLSSFSPSRIIFHRKVSLENMVKLSTMNLEYEAFVLNENCHFHGGYCQSLHCDSLSHMCHLPYRMEKEVETQFVEYEGLGSSGCGLCALWQLEQIGIQYGKLVSRGNFVENTIEDIMSLKRALAIVKECLSEQEYVERMKKELFSYGCSGQCYFRNGQNGPFVKI